MSWFKELLHKVRDRSPSPIADNGAPPEWAPAPERSHTLGLINEATDDEFASAEKFCAHYPPNPPRLLSSEVVQNLEEQGCRYWGIEYPRSPRFKGEIHNGDKKESSLNVVKVKAKKDCQDVCLFSTLPIMAGLYDIQGKSGIYYEVLIHKMNGIIAIGASFTCLQSVPDPSPIHKFAITIISTGTACQPYPDWRFPGWNRLSAGLHLDDMRKFCEDPDGGRDYSPLITRISPGDIVGCGFDFTRNSIFFTYNGQRLPDAFSGLYVPRANYDVYAAIGVEGACEFEVNFGGDVFRWKEGNEWAWRVEGHVGKMAGGPSGGEELPEYSG